VTTAYNISAYSADLVYVFKGDCICLCVQAKEGGEGKMEIPTL
jgi:hypothetical protein